MNFKEIIEKIKGFINVKKEQFDNLNKEKKIAIIIGAVAIILSIVFGIIYMNNNRYQVLFSGLDSSDAIAVTNELEAKNVKTKVEGDSIYVPKEEVDRLRLELSEKVTNGSTGFEIMDSGSSFGMTDEEFAIQKQRMTQGEIERTIKTFSQVEDARVHITNGEQSVFASESIPGTAAVYIDLKPGSSLEQSQVRSIISLVSASTFNIPKQNVEVIDQNMNLLSDGLFDEDGNVSASGTNGLDIARNAEKQLNADLERSILGLLEPMFGQGKVKVAVNSDLNFDSSEITEIVIDPDSVITRESISENITEDSANSSGAVDNNMGNTGDVNTGITESRDEEREYETGKTETKTITAQGGINKITASVAIDGNLDAVAINNVMDMVGNVIGADPTRGDDITVVSVPFADTSSGLIGDIAGDAQLMSILRNVAIVVGILLLLIIATVITMYIRKRRNDENDIDEDAEIDLINQKLEEMEMNRLVNGEEEEENISLEEEVRRYADSNPEQVTELINSWLKE